MDRKKENSRKEIINEIYERQLQYYNKTSFIPLLIYPEGSTTCGRNILKFKKGAFVNLLPIKPNIISINQKNECHLASGCQDMLLNTLKFFCYSYAEMYYINMPIFNQQITCLKNIHISEKKNGKYMLKLLEKYFVKLEDLKNVIKDIENLINMDNL